MTDAKLVRQVAEEVMDYVDAYIDDMPIGWKTPDGRTISYDDFKPPTNANHRDMVVERMIGLGFDVKLQYYCDDTEGWQVKFVNPKEEIETLDAIMKGANGGDKESFELALEARKQYTDIKTRWHINKKIGRAVCEAALAAVRGSDG